MKYRHTFRVKASPAAVAEFHQRQASLAQITPPPIRVQMPIRPAGPMQEGDELAFTLWLGPLPVHWRARFEHISEHGFTDRQVSGPFRRWVHRHAFDPHPHGGTLVIDEIDLSLRLHPLWGPVGLGMVLGLPLLFAFRGYKTRRLLQG